MRYVYARAKKEYRDEAYRIYISESLRLLPQNKIFKFSYSEIVKGESEMPNATETKISDEALEEAAKKIGIKINWGR